MSAQKENKKRFPLQIGSGSQRAGARGESRACLYLRLHGYRILERNWLCGHKEVDIIAKKGETVAFIEVKSRRRVDGIAPSQSVTNAKKRNLIAASRVYIPMHGIHKAVIRFDIIEVDLSKKLPLSGIKHFINAFN